MASPSTMGFAWPERRKKFSMSSEQRAITVPQFAAMKAAGRKITMLTAYDYATAELVDAAGIDGILVGDSLSMVVQGHANTLPVTLDEMIYHAEMVGRAVAPCPAGGRHAVSQYSARCSQGDRKRRADLEGDPLPGREVGRRRGAGRSDCWPGLRRHTGDGPLRPMSAERSPLGGYRVERDAVRLLADAHAAQAAGAFAIVLECIPAASAARITAELKIPTIGIGAGAGCDGQVLVYHDLLGLTPGRSPRHAKPYADLRRIVMDAVTRYRDDVRQGTFPGPEQTFE